MKLTTPRAKSFTLYWRVTTLGRAFTSKGVFEIEDRKEIYK